MENTFYLDTEETSLDTVDTVYDKLFKKFHFCHSIDEADTVVIAGKKDVPYNVSKVFLLKPDNVSFETFKDDKGSEVYVSFSNNLGVVEDIVVFLNSRKFYSSDEGEIEVVSHISKLLKIKEGSFLETLLSQVYPLIEENVTFNDYLSFILNTLLETEGTSNVASAPQGATLVNRYINEFYVSFTSRDFPGCSDSASNYETREFIGDRVAWSTMTRYFLNRFGTLNQNQMTHLHQLYCSTDIEASISYSLFFWKFIRTSSRITRGTYEDLFESFIGTLFEISNREKISGTSGSNLELHKLFLNKLYDSFEISPCVTKPPKTELSELLVSLTSRSDKCYNIKVTKNSVYIVLFQRGEMMKQVLSDKLRDETKVELLLNLFRTRRNFNELNEETECNTYYKSIIKGIKEVVGEDTLCDLQNLKSLTMDQLNTLKETLGTGHFVCHLRNIERNWSDTFWELECNDEVYSTELLANPDMFETLVSLLKGELKEVTNDRPLLLNDYNGEKDFILVNDTKKGIPSDATVYRVKSFLLQNSNAKLYTVILDENVDCSVEDFLQFRPQFHRFINCIPSDTSGYIKCIAELLGDVSGSISAESDRMCEYIGNRLIWTYGNRVFYSLFKNANEFQLDAFQKYYTSKVVKREIGRLMKIPSNLSLDEVLGRLPESTSESLINLIYLNLIVNEEDTMNYMKETNTICALLEQQLVPPVKKDKKEPEVAQKKHFSKSYFKVVKDEYHFKFNDVTASVSFKYKSYSWIRVLFEKQVYNYMINKIGALNVSMMLNRRFRSNPTFNKLCLLLKHRNLNNFSITTIELKNKKRFKLVIRGYRSIIFDTLEEAYTSLSVV